MQNINKDFRWAFLEVQMFPLLGAQCSALVSVVSLGHGPEESQLWRGETEKTQCSRRQIDLNNVIFLQWKRFSPYYIASSNNTAVGGSGRSRVSLNHSCEKVWRKQSGSISTCAWPWGRGRWRRSQGVLQAIRRDKCPSSGVQVKKYCNRESWDEWAKLPASTRSLRRAKTALSLSHQKPGCPAVRALMTND